jgi:SAM-dependent methyltransferase
MEFQLAVVLWCTETGCQVQFVDHDAQVEADYSAPMVDNQITVEAGHLVAVDRGADPPQVVFWWPSIETERAEGEFVLFREGNPVDPEQLRAEFFPRIRVMYQRLKTVSALDPKQVVGEGYDRIAEEHLEWVQSTRDEERARYTHVLLDGLPTGAEVLDLGCGAGVPTTRALAQRFRVTGVDISARQIELARQHVSHARFVQADITQLDFPPASFDGVAAFYSIIHVPQEEKPGLLQDIAAWLRPDGLLVATMGAHSAKVDYADDFLGAPMYWSTFDSQTNRHLVEEAGLHIVSAREETVEEFGEPTTFLWIVARKQ